MFKKLFNAAWMALLFACCQLAAAAPTVSVTATPNNPIAPASVTLAVAATSDSGPVMATQVEYFSGTASLGVALQAPYTLKLDNLAVGTYQVTAKITTTDPNSPTLQSAPLTVTVGAAPGVAKAYFIETDQLNTPRAITNAAGDLVWQWDSDPFGKDAPNEQPAGQPAFTLNQRFPGQQFDRESNLYYNYYRDYDPALGRYIQSDLIGLEGGINTYGYVLGNPLVRVDRNGLAPFGVSDFIQSRGQGYDFIKAISPDSNPNGSIRIIPPFPSRSEHINRNANNSCPLKKPSTGGQCPKWTQDNGVLKMMNGGKFRSDRGDECAYDADGNLLPDENGNYTYNFSPDPNTKEHIWQDVLPHYIYGGHSSYTPGLTRRY